MISLLSIIKLTAKAAIRSHVFQLLLVILLLCVFLVPLTITGDGTAYGFIQISLKYSLGIVAFILSLTTVWLGCFSLSQDVESYQLHMVVTKPVSRVKIWLGKCFGVIVIHFILLIISALVIYFTVQWQFTRKSFTAKEKKRIESEVMVGRRVFFPERPDINALARQVYKQRLAELRKEGKGKVKVDEAMGLAEMRKKVMASLSEVRFGPANTRIWKYKGIPSDLKQPLFLRFRAYVNKVSTKEQRMTRGLWNVMMEVPTDKIKDGKKVMKPYFFPTSNYPIQYMTGIFHELQLRPDAVLSNNEVQVAFSSFDPQRKPLFFQMSDGPKLLVKVSGFFGNYCRAVLVVFLQLVILAGLACAAAAVLSMPTAVFMVFSYLLFGIFAQFLVGSGAEMATESVTNFIGYWVSRFLLLIIIPMQNFEVSQFIANGELIEFSFIGSLFLNYFVLRGLPFFLLGIYLYRRREMGLVIRK